METSNLCFPTSNKFYFRCLYSCGFTFIEESFIGLKEENAFCHQRFIWHVEMLACLHATQATLMELVDEYLVTLPPSGNIGLENYENVARAKTYARRRSGVPSKLGNDEFLTKTVGFLRKSENYIEKIADSFLALYGDTILGDLDMVPFCIEGFDM